MNALQIQCSIFPFFFFNLNTSAAASQISLKKLHIRTGIFFSKRGVRCILGWNRINLGCAPSLNERYIRTWAQIKEQALCLLTTTYDVVGSSARQVFRQILLKRFKGDPASHYHVVRSSNLDSRTLLSKKNASYLDIKLSYDLVRFPRQSSFF